MSKKLVVSLVLILMFCSNAFAGTEKVNDELSKIPSQSRYTYISSTSALLTIDSMGLASCFASIQAYNTVDSVRISAYLERYDNGWGIVKYWGENYTGNYGVMAKSWYVLKGYQYRWRVYYYAYSGNNTESTSRTVYYSYY